MCDDKFFEVPNGMDTYPALMGASGYLLPPIRILLTADGDLTGKEVANRVCSKVCDEAESHLWFDLEVFSFQFAYSSFRLLVCPAVAHNNGFKSNMPKPTHQHTLLVCWHSHHG